MGPALPGMWWMLQDTNVSMFESVEGNVAVSAVYPW